MLISLFKCRCGHRKAEHEKSGYCLLCYCQRFHRFGRKFWKVCPSCGYDIVRKSTTCDICGFNFIVPNGGALWE